MKRLLLLALVTARGVVGCANTFFPLASDQVFETLLRADCSYTFNCCEPAERTGFGVLTADEATCVEEGLEEGGETALRGQRAKAAIDAGKATYDAELAERCMRPLLDAAQHCDPGRSTLPIDAACAEGFRRAFAVGVVKDGEACTDSIECADEGFCVRDPEAPTITMAGTCKASASAGDNCSERSCKAGFDCILDGETPTCTKIELVDNDGACVENAQCRSGNCAPTRLCRETGGVCVVDGDCGEGGRCDEGIASSCAAPQSTEICNGRE
jgi:hypothetical protein